MYPPTFKLDNLYYHNLDKDGKLNLEDVFEGLKLQVGVQLCHLAPRFSEFINFQDQPCRYPYSHQCDSEILNERPGTELSFLYLLSLNTPCTTAFTTPISY